MHQRVIGRTAVELVGHAPQRDTSSAISGTHKGEVGPDAQVPPSHPRPSPPPGAEREKTEGQMTNAFNYGDNLNVPRNKIVATASI